MEKLQLPQFKQYLQPRARDYHKGQCGHVLIIGGDYGYAGAMRMAAEAALRVGAGLVSVATRPEHAMMLNATRPEIMCHAVSVADKLQDLLEKVDVVIIGPGMGQSVWAQALWTVVLRSELPLIVDADALNLLAVEPHTRENWILTPHPGEAARLLQQTAAEVQNNRLASVTRLQKQFHGVCVLKGAGSLIAEPNSISICEAGNPGMATAGMGDVLSGVIGSLVAQDIPLTIAAKLGVFLHATAGDLAAKEEGERGMVALDLMPYLRRLVN